MHQNSLVTGEGEALASRVAEGRFLLKEPQRPRIRSFQERPDTSSPVRYHTFAGKLRTDCSRIWQNQPAVWNEMTG